MRKLVILFSLLLVLIVGCSKEYSYEGGPPVVIDTTRPPVIINEFPFCPACTTINTPNLWQWSFKSGNSILCGKADTAILNPERTAFTFFGPSSCSRDTGIIVSVYLNTDTLNKDKTNFTVSRFVFYYYDRITPSYIFMSLGNNPLSGTITSYNHQTKIITGTFQGNVFRPNGNGTSITSGNFKMKII